MLHLDAVFVSVLSYSGAVSRGTKLGLKEAYLKQLQDVSCYFCKRDEEGTSFNEVAIVKIWVKKVQFVCML